MAFNTTSEKATRVSIDLSSFVNTERNAIAQVRARERAAREARFQEVVMSEGLSYEAQLDYRKQQFEKEKNSTTPDEEYMAEIRQNMGKLRKLIRFEKVRNDYLDNYDQLIEGKVNLKEHEKFIQGMLNETSDPEQRKELRQEISNIRDKIVQEQKATLQNRVALAQKDGTVNVLESTIDDLARRKAFAESNGNTEEASHWSVSLTSLKKQLSETKIANEVHDISFNINRDDTTLNPIEKLDELSSRIESASSDAPVTVNGVNYESEKDFWRSARDNYLAGQGNLPGMKSFFNEMENEVQSKVDRLSKINKHGFVPLPTLDSIARDYKSLANREEFKPFLDKLESSEVNALSYGVMQSADALTKASVQSLQGASGVKALDTLQSRYGIDLTSQKFALSEKIIQAGGSLESRGEAINMLEQVGAETPPENIEPGTDPSSLIETNNQSRTSQAGVKTSSFPSVGRAQRNQQQQQGGDGQQITDRSGIDSGVDEDATQDSTQPTDSRSGVSVGVNTNRVQENDDGDAGTSPKFREIEIQSGETLSSIAQRELGDANRFNEIARMNNIDDPDKIKAGNKIRVPVNLGK